MRCLAIDDEPLAVKQIVGYISRIPSLELVRTFSNATDALQYLTENGDVDLIFVDINMPDLTGIDLVRSLAEPPMVIFTTAYSEYAIEGYKLDAIDYLLKPFSFAEFERSVTKAESLFELFALKRDMQSDGMADSDAAADTDGPEEASVQDKRCISVRADYKTTLVRIDSIIYIESVGEYVRMHLNDGQKIVTLLRLQNVESTLPDDTFMRVHRSYIINLNCVTGYTKGRVFLNNDDYVPIGENYKDVFLRYAEDKF